MKTQRAYPSRVAEGFRMHDAPTLVTRALHKSTISVTELRCDRPNFGRTASMPREDAYLVALQLRACPDHDLYFDGRRVQPANYRAGVTSIYDLRHDPIADIRDPFHCLMFHLPRKALDIMADEPECRGPAIFGINRGSASTIRLCGICYQRCSRRWRSLRKPIPYSWTTSLWRSVLTWLTCMVA